MEVHAYELQYLYSQGIDFYDRRIHLCGEITEESASTVIRGLYLLARTSDPIEILIQSGGGYLGSTLAIYDTISILNKSTLPIHTVGTGEVCSAALLLLACGYTRSASENIYAMAHSASAGAEEMETHSLLSLAEAADDMSKKMWDLLAKHTKRTATQWKKAAKEAGEVWMKADDLKKYGVIDDIISPAMIVKKRRAKPSTPPRTQSGSRKKNK